MAARGSLWRNLIKWGTGRSEGRCLKAVAIVTAFRAGNTLTQNRKRNIALRQDLETFDLSYYPVIGSGQEAKRFFLVFRLVVPSHEESFVVQPRSEMGDETFRSIVLGLIDRYDQDFAAVKLPKRPTAFLLFRDGREAPLGTTAMPRKGHDAFYSELLKGPRTPVDQLSAWEAYGERNPLFRLANRFRGRTDLNLAVSNDRRGGRRFVIRSPRAADGGNDV